MLEHDGGDAGLRDPGEEGAELREVGPHRPLHLLPPLVVLVRSRALHITTLKERKQYYL